MTRASFSLAVALGLALSACSESNESGTDVMDTAAIPADAASQPAVSELVFCKIVGRRTTQQDCDDLQATAETAERGVAAFNVPDKMVRDTAVTIQLAVGFAPEPASPEANAAPSPLDTLTAVDAAGAGEDVADSRPQQTAEPPKPDRPAQTPEEAISGQPGEVESYQPIVGKNMRAELLGQGFRVEPQSPAEQSVSDYGVTTWQWTVTPLERGPHTLTLKTVVLAYGADGKRYELIPTIRNQPVEVNLTTWQRILDVVEGLPVVVKLLTAAVTAITGLVVALWALRRALSGKADKAKTPQQEPGGKPS